MAYRANTFSSSTSRRVSSIFEVHRRVLVSMTLSSARSAIPSVFFLFNFQLHSYVGEILVACLGPNVAILAYTYDVVFCESLTDFPKSLVELLLGEAAV